MKLSIDSIRKILLCLEQNLVITEEGEMQPVHFKDIAKWCSLSNGETINTLLALKDAEFIAAAFDDGDDNLLELEVYRLTFDGYQFLESIRSNTVFDKVKGFLSKYGIQSFDTVKQIAGQVIVSMVSDYLK